MRGHDPHEREDYWNLKFRLNPALPPKLTQRVRERLATKPDEAIDFSDIPPTYGVAWTRPGLPEPAERKRQITLQIDADILAYFQTTGRTYRARINRVLRSYVDAQRAGRRKSSAP
jgi:uncharacterized protein (DUF4415 family)